ncbi:hypothetical protein H310_11440 [Aphanomyces invadans]|uniref:Uncharacterized protein n=1 Tax=Aphanomyces invadans TaxID=157072 RepID=A0A024TMB7_9STRA|nr:hypothetical protein H310_11440 [Aphanomyces invadans]ETV95178.1 hypothetical protein H310_11440 [Aphanomyces invadans]|eukprot:XP_008876351.1 hypothetical protein H310_11440 [Aphanomyces invadans]
MLERVHPKQIHKHVLGTWLEESFASGKPRSINDAIRYCSLHIDGFTDKKIRSQRAWVSRAIRSLDLDEYISRSKPTSSKKPKIVLMSPSSPSTLQDVEREVSEILVQMQDDSSFAQSASGNWCHPPPPMHFTPIPPHYEDSNATSWGTRPPLPPLYSPHHTAPSSTMSDRQHFNPFAQRRLTDGDYEPPSRW